MEKKNELKEKNVSELTELTELLREKREKLRVVRFSATGAKLPDSNEPRKLRADIARIMTELGARSKQAS